MAAKTRRDLTSLHAQDGSEKDIWYQWPLWQQTGRSIWPFGSTGHQRTSCRWRRRGRGRRPPAPCRTRGKSAVWVLFRVPLCWMEKWNVLEVNDQIYARRSLHSPTAADGRTAPCRRLSASPASTPPWSLCLQDQKIRRRCSMLKTQQCNSPVVSWCTLGRFRPARRAASVVLPTPLLPERKTL